jgi:hypothetical protein
MTPARLRPCGAVRRRLKKRDRRQPHKVRAAPRSGAATTIAAICARQAGAAANIGPLRRHLGSTIDGSCAALKLLHIAKYH